MRTIIKTILILLLVLVAGAGGAFLLDKLLSRPDRIAATRRVDLMISVRDQLLRYELEHGSLPRTLAEMVPRYVQAEQLVNGSLPLYRYDPERRLLAQTQGSRVRRLLRLEERPPVVMILPPPEEAPKVVGIGTVEVPDLLEGGGALIPGGPRLPPPPKGALVWEAEHFTEMNWGWEIHPDPACSGGAFLHSWEGITNGPAQEGYGIFNYYDICPPKEFTSLRYHFHLPQAGRYHLYGRMWTTDTHCSNDIHVAIDQSSYNVGSMDNRTPFRWVWTEVQEGPLSLKAGDHYLYVFIHEDGLSLDQFMLSPTEVSGSDALQPNLLPGQDTEWVKKKGPPVHLSFDLKSMLISPDSPPECNVVLRRLRPGAGTALLRVTLEAAALGGRDWHVLERKLDLSRLPEVCFVPLSFQDLDLSKLERREYLLRADLLSQDKPVAGARVTLERPFDWQVSGMFNYMSNETAGPLDGIRELKPGDPRAWVPLKESCMTHFGVLDFGLHTSGNTLNAPAQKTIYARTRIAVPKTDAYLFLAQSDDHMLLWVDGKLVYSFTNPTFSELPVTRSAARAKVSLEAGEHELRMRVNQLSGPWQASVRIRTHYDDISGVVGLPWPEEKAPPVANTPPPPKIQPATELPTSPSH